MKTLDFFLIDWYNHFRASGCGEVWYRAWFGTKRPWVQVPSLRPYRVFITQVNTRFSFLNVALYFDSAFMYRAGFRLLFLLCREIFHDHALTVFLHSNGIEIIITIISVCSFTNVQTGKKTKNMA